MDPLYVLGSQNPWLGASVGETLQAMHHTKDGGGCHPIVDQPVHDALWQWVEQVQAQAKGHVEHVVSGWARDSPGVQDFVGS